MARREEGSLTAEGITKRLSGRVLEEFWKSGPDFAVTIQSMPRVYGHVIVSKTKRRAIGGTNWKCWTGLSSM